MPVTASYDYAIIRVVPRVERQEFVNAGAVLFCRTLRFLDARVALQGERLSMLAPGLDIEYVSRALDSFRRICGGGPDSGPIGHLDLPARFHWLVSPRSAVIQTSAVHCGICSDPAVELDRIMHTLVLPFDADEVGGSASQLPGCGPPTG